MGELYNKHYITVDKGHIINGFSDDSKQPQGNDICINEQGSRQFRLLPGGRENPPLIDTLTNCHLYRYEGGQIRKATEAEIAAELAEIEANRPPVPPSPIEELQAENKLLTAQIQAQADRQEFAEDCIAEIAMQLYA